MQQSDNRALQLLTEKEAAGLLRRSLAAVRIDRRRGAGPAYIRMGVRRVMYRPDDLESFIQRRRIADGEPEAMQGAAAGGCRGRS